MDDEQLRHYCEIDAEKHQIEIMTKYEEEAIDVVIHHIMNAAFILDMFEINDERIQRVKSECKNALNIILEKLIKNTPK